MSQIQCPNCGSFKIISRDGGGCGAAWLFFLIGGFVTLGSVVLGFPDGRALNTPSDLGYALAHTPLAVGLLLLGLAVFFFSRWRRYSQQHFVCETCGKWIDI